MVIFLDEFFYPVIGTDGLSHTASITVRWDETTHVYYVIYSDGGSGQPQPSSVTALQRGRAIGDLLTTDCIGGDLYTFKAMFNSPFAYSEYTPGGCAPPIVVCDLALTVGTVTNQSAPGVNDGTAQILATSSHGGILYSIDGGTHTQSSNTFTGLAPGAYTATVTDSGPCSQTIGFSINPATYIGAGEKYRLEFTTLKDQELISVRFFKAGEYFGYPDYPKYLTGAADVLIDAWKNDNEDKFEPIITRALDINLLNNGVFDINEFQTADERTWLIKYYIDGALDFQGWLIPDEIQDLYNDTPYSLLVKATDGLASLSGLPLKATSGLAVYGLQFITSLWKYALSQLGYDYSDTLLLSSLRFNEVDTSQQWSNVTTWGDVFYDSNGAPQDFYKVLQAINTAFGLQLFQHKGQFILWHANDLSYASDTSRAAIYAASLKKFNSSFSSETTGTTLPAILKVGYNNDIKTCNPSQLIRMDKAVSILTMPASYSSIALLYNDPGFEATAAGKLPVSWTETGTFAPECRIVNIGYDAYDGSNVFRIGNGQNAFTQYVELSVGNPLPDAERKINFGFNWKPVYYSPSYNTIPLFSITLMALGTEYALTTDGHWTAVSGTDFIILRDSRPITDYSAWNAVNFSSDKVPATGDIRVRFYGVQIITPGGSISYPPDPGSTYYLYIDNFQLSIAQDTNLNYQKGETNRLIGKSQTFRAQPKNIDQVLFTYPGDKYATGNVIYNTGSVLTQTMWKWALEETTQVYQRLLEALVKQVGTNYKRPMYIFDGDLYSDNISFYNLFTIDGYEGKIFMPLSIKKNVRKSTVTVVLVETDNKSFNYDYRLLATFADNVRTY